MNHLEYVEKVLNESDNFSDKIKEDAKKRGLVHQSHNIWKDKSGRIFKWNTKTKKFENGESKKIDNENKDPIYQLLNKYTMENDPYNLIKSTYDKKLKNATSAIYHLKHEDNTKNYSLEKLNDIITGCYLKLKSKNSLNVLYNKLKDIEHYTYTNDEEWE